MRNPYIPYEDVNIILDILLAGVKDILKERFVGMHLFGSLANGDFDMHSDVDVLVVAKDEVPEPMFSTLHAMHERIASLDSPWTVQLEVSYIPQTALRRFDRTNMLHPHIDRGRGEKLHRMQHESDWVIQRHILREKGIAVEGPPPHTLIDPVSADKLRRSVVDVLPLWINPLLEDPAQQIRPRGYQSFIVLSLCRMLYTLQYGEIVSKQAAAKWAMKTLDTQWNPLIERAIIGRENSRLEVDPQDLNGTQDFMRYALKHSRPTLYFDVNQILHLLLAEAREILLDQFVGMYLYGSLSSGDFDLKTSDIDFLVLTEEILPDETVSALEAMHNRIWASGLKWASKLEGAYVPRDLIRCHDPAGPACPSINEGKFYLDQRGSDWIIQRHVIREQGVILAGPDPKTLIDPISADDIRGAVMGVLREWWFPMLDDPSWLREHEAGDRAFAVITMCRVLHALEHGTISSKPKAMEWTCTKLEAPWPELIDRAGTVTNTNSQDISLNEALDLIRYVRSHVSLCRLA